MLSADSVDYVYDGFGRRALVEYSSTDKRAYFYQMDGTVHEKYEYDGSTWTWDQIFFYVGGEHIGTQTNGGGMRYNFRDVRGDLRARVSIPGTVTSRHDFYPFGGERAATSTDESRVFTGQERDDESTLDHFWFRKYQSNWGRWTSPDPLFGNIGNPQSLNRYGYVLNDPTNLIDPLGLHECEAPYLWNSGFGYWPTTTSGHHCVNPLDTSDRDIDMTHCLPGSSLPWCLPQPTEKNKEDSKETGISPEGCASLSSVGFPDCKIPEINECRARPWIPGCDQVFDMEERIRDAYHRRRSPPFNFACAIFHTVHPDTAKTLLAGAVLSVALPEAGPVIMGGAVIGRGFVIYRRCE